MSCPFKPGDRVVKVAQRENKPPRYTATPIGTVATVINEPLKRRSLERGFDMKVIHDDGLVTATDSYRWRRIDGPSGESAESFLQSLSKPKVEA